MALKKIKIGDIVVCVRPISRIPLHNRYRILDIKEGVTVDYYTLIDDDGLMYSYLYSSDHFVSVKEFKSAIGLNKVIYTCTLF
jgi:hypothetical protein